MSKDIKQNRLGQKRSTKSRIIGWVVTVLAMGGAGFAAYRLTESTEVDVAVAKVRRADFVISVRARGEIKSTTSVTLTAPQVPNVRIVKLAESGRAVKKGEVVVEFDAAQQEQNLLERTTTVCAAESEIVQTKASHTIENEADSMNLMTAGYNVQRAKLEASKAEIVSEIEGAKNRIQVGVRGREEAGGNGHRIPQGSARGRHRAVEPEEGQDPARRGAVQKVISRRWSLSRRSTAS